MEIEFDQDKRDKTLQERGLDFARVDEVFASVTVTIDGYPQGLWRDEIYLHRSA